MAFSVRTISADEHRAYNAAQPSVSFLQTPAWGQVKREWRSESIGWFDGDDQLAGAGLVLYRQLPRIKKYLAYLPEGPVVDWLGRGCRGPAPAAGRPCPDRRSVRHPHRRAGGGPPLERGDDQGGDRRRAGEPTQRGDARPHRPRRGPPSPPAARARLASARRGGRLRGRAAPVRLPAADRRPDRRAAAGRDEPAVAAQHQEGGQGRRGGQPGDAG